MKKHQRTLLKFYWLMLPSGPFGDLYRGNSYRKYILECGKNFKVGESAYIYSPEKLSVGDDVYIGFSSYLGNGTINIGSEVLLGNHVSITPSNHLPKGGSFRFGGFDDRGITISDGVWIGAHACLLAGVTIGAGSLIAAGAVVTHSVSERVVVAGVPAKIIKKY